MELRKKNYVNKIVSSMREVDISDLGMPIIAIYKNPEDFPHSCITRIYDADKPTDTIVIRERLEELIKDIEDAYPEKVFIERGKEDVLSLVGVYM